MSNIKQLLEKANRKCEMRWRVFAFDPAKDNELVHTSKDAFDCIKMAGEYKMDLAKKHPDYIIEIIAESKEQRNEADKVFLKKIEDVLHRYNLPSAKIVDERKVDNTHYIYKIDVNLTDYAKSLQKDAIDFDKVKKDNALKALSFLTIDGIYPQRNSQSILMQVNFHKGKPESAQKNEAYKVGDRVRVTSNGTFGYGNTGIIRAINGDKFTIDFNAPNSGTIKLSAKDITKESSQKNEEKEFTIKLVTPFGKAKVCSWKANSVDAAVKEFLDANPAYRENKKGAVIAESAQKNEATYDIHTLKMDPASNPYKALPFKFSAGDILKSRDGKRQMKVLRKAGTQYEVQINNEPKKVVEVTELRNFLVESLGDDIVREVKEEVKDGVKDLVQQDVDAKLNGEVTPADYQATYGEDIDDDSDSIFDDELDNVEPEQSIRR